MSSTKELSPMFAYLSSNIDNLIALLADHPSMTAEVTLETQPKNKIHYMYDYMTRTKIQLDELDPTVPASQNEQWSEVLQRSLFANILINDQPEKLSKLTQEDEGKELEFGEKIRAAAGALTPEGIRQSLAINDMSNAVE